MNESFWHSILQNVRDGVIVTDENLRVTFANQAALEKFGFSQAELECQSVLGLISQQKSEEAQVYLQSLTSKDQPEELRHEFTLFGIKKDLSFFPMQIQVDRLVGEEKPYLVIQVRDVYDPLKAQKIVLDQVQRLNAIRKVDTAITHGNNLSIIFDVVLNEMITLLEADAVSILRFNRREKRLEFAAERGFRTNALQYTRLRLGEGYAGKAALHHKVIYVEDLREHKTDFLRSPLFSSEGFITYHAVPLVVKENVLGVIEVFHRRSFNPDIDWRNFLESLADQTAIALDNAQLFYGLQQANRELVEAYDETIDGWSRALDLRDHETEGHTQRVTQMTLRLAEILGLSGDALLHIRRGAMLHDIGKMGVPDRILLKPDRLTEEETLIMHQHPTFSFNMLYPIVYLRPALDIPYCHHEKWDGSGYPRGLKREEIPLAARIFAVVDVWDALRSDRPYRPAWPREQVIEYIRSLSGIHFDPAIVPVFLQMIESEEYRGG